MQHRNIEGVIWLLSKHSTKLQIGLHSRAMGGDMLPLLLYTAGSGGNYQIASITALLLLIPSLVFMFIVERFLKADVLSRVGH